MKDDLEQRADEVTIGGSLILSEPVKLPEVLDVLVVGGGPAGTAAAFRARELGLDVLVLDYDDLMKRIRDYSKEKEILPSFGGADAVPFPDGGDLIQGLRFDPMDKDEMVLSWKARYRNGNVPARIGVELTGLGERRDRIWSVQCFNRRTQEPLTYLARSVVLAIGRGVPRRFDIPGNTLGIAFRLEDPARYVGAPACVVGGGTSAAEAVIAISRAKSEAEDPSLVYWSYRGESLPKVSDSLSKTFFDAFVGNGNIVYLRRSEPTGIVVGYDRQEYLSIRIDRREMPGRPAETVHMEFPKQSVVACIGEDVPESLLKSMGIELGIGVDGKKRTLLTAELESRQESVFLVGDLLAPYYWQTPSFDASPDSWVKTKHQGNIKTALHDGVRVAEVIYSRKTGKAASSPAGGMPALEVKPAAPRQYAQLLRLYPASDPEAFPITKDVVTIGKMGCDINFESELVAEHQASIQFNADAGIHEIRDMDSDNGTYVYLKGKESGSRAVAPGTLLLAGKQRLLVGQDGGGAPLLIHRDTGGRKLGEHPLKEGRTVIGRDGEIRLPADDSAASGSHLTITRSGSALEVQDHSKNGTLVRVTGSCALRSGMRFVIGHAHFVFEAAVHVAPTGPGREPLPERAAAPPPAPCVDPAPAATGPRPAAPEPSKAPVSVALAPPKRESPPAGSRAVVFEGFGSFPIEPGQSILDIALANRIPLAYDCKDGTCGSDPIEVLEGAEFLKPMGDREEGGLESAGCLRPGCRLACCVRDMTGTVRVRLITKV